MIGVRFTCHTVTRAARAHPQQLVDTLQREKRLDWTAFSRRNAVQPLKIVASGLLSCGPVVLDSAHAHFNSLGSLAECLRASRSETKKDRIPHTKPVTFLRVSIPAAAFPVNPNLL